MGHDRKVVDATESRLDLTSLTPEQQAKPFDDSLKLIEPMDDDYLRFMVLFRWQLMSSTSLICVWVVCCPLFFLFGPLFVDFSNLALAPLGRYYLLVLSELYIVHRRYRQWLPKWENQI